VFLNDEEKEKKTPNFVKIKFEKISNLFLFHFELVKRNAAIFDLYLRLALSSNSRSNLDNRRIIRGKKRKNILEASEGTK